MLELPSQPRIAGGVYSVGRSVTNALGQLVRVDEPDANNQLGAADAPSQPTFYSYDTLNNLTTVTQGVQTRSFTYDSLSRLLSATNPESGTINYVYDANGNLTRKTDARGVRTEYVYDALNRVTNRNYSTPNGTPPNYQATPDVSYFYDNLPNAKGKLIKVSSSVSATEYTAFDILGRVTASKQTTGGGDAAGYTTGYVYNLSGALIEETYPSGRVVKNTLDASGDLAQVQSQKNASDVWRTYANSFVYTAAGAVSSVRLGNGRFENTQFNSRLQPVQIGLGSSASTQNLLRLDLDYGTTDNNGNVQSQTITVPTVGQNPGFTAVQNYTYDTLNRLKSATETIVGQTPPSWKQTFTFDRYGNRRFDESNTTTIPQGCPEAICNPQINTATNKLIGYTFDSSGNTTTDANEQTFNYDAENKQTEVKDANGYTIGQYFYDGDGKRVKKEVPATGEVTIFVYDAGGKLVAEYSTIVEPVETAKVAYLTNDHLGSPRITTDATGQVISRRDFMPFGEEISTPQRTQTLAYTADNIRQKFTGYERDNESSLDFAEARMFAYNHGRFMSPDDFGNDTDVADPQSWNLYVYVRNNPLKYIDPTGEEIWISFQEEEEYEENGEKKKRTVTRRVQYRNGALYNQDGSDYTGNNQYALNARDYLNTLSQDRELGRMISDLDRSRKVHTIMKNPDDPSENGVELARNGTTVYWSGEQSSYKDDNGNRIPMDAIFTLAHELLGHSWFIDRGRERKGSELVYLGRTSTGHSASSLVERNEIDAVSVQNRAHRLLGQRERLFYRETSIAEYLADSFISPRRPPKLKVAPARRPR